MPTPRPRSGSTASRSAARRRAAPARAGLCCVPEERNGHARRARLHASPTTRVLSGRDRAWAASPAASSAPARRRDYAGRGDPATSTCKRDRRRRAGAQPLRRQPAEIHHGPRDPAEARACWSSRQPTWGVDAGAAAAIHQALVDLAADGLGRRRRSRQDLDELLTLSDRLAVINVGRAVRADADRATPRSRRSAC